MLLQNINIFVYLSITHFVLQPSIMTLMITHAVAQELGPQKVLSDYCNRDIFVLSANKINLNIF